MTQTTFQDRQRDAAMQLVREQQAARNAVVDALNLFPGDHAEKVIHLTNTSAVVEIVQRDDTGAVTYTVVHDGKPARVHVETLELALLLAVQLMVGGRPQDRDYVYAAKVLGF
jgi:hypothetical protein